MDSEHLDQLSICDIVYQPIIAPILGQRQKQTPRNKQQLLSPKPTKNPHKDSKNTRQSTEK